MTSSLKLISFLLILIIPLIVCETYYELLGIQKDANDKEIRKAFKKLALIMHPDKNQNDENASEKFIKINRAYEVLKDGELRKKYDLHGEEGLDESKQNNWGQKFHSWNYYKNDFGIYDDDSEIITLSYSDFVQSVRGTADIWFVNFYSPQCSHCHTLAPVWRKVAIELEGVVRIGAVNCGDDWQLCNSEGIRAYPSLKLYPENIKFDGDRTFEKLISFMMSKLPNNIIILKNDNFEELMKNSDKPWLVFFSDYSEDSISPKNKRKLAVSLNEMISVADVDCQLNAEVCKHFKKQNGFYLYMNIAKPEEHYSLETYDTVEVTKYILERLPDLKKLKENEFEKIIKKLNEGKDAPWLIHFLEEKDESSLEFKKLPTLLSDMNFGQIDCRIMRTLCNNHHVHKYPTFIVFKHGGSYEFYHGRLNAHDIAAFARESASSPVKTLLPKDFPGVTNDERPYFVDFYAPWCPPCQQLLPEWRKTAKDGRNIANFGTVDCTIHTVLCNQYNIRSYPSAILFIKSKSHQFHGQKNSHSFIEFIQDLLNPLVIELDSKSFSSSVKQRKSDEIWVVDFFSPWCGPCQQLSPEWRKLAKMMLNNTYIRIAHVDCTAHSQLCSEEGVQSYPSIRLYPMEGRGSSKFFNFNGWNRNAGSLKTWLYQYLPSKVKNINQKDFMETVLHDSKPWLIDFYATWCGHCQTFAPVFEFIAEAFNGRINVAKLDCGQHSDACQHADIHAYPTVRFYPGSRSSSSSQNMWGEEIGSLDYEFIISFVEGRLHELNLKRKDEL